MLSTGKSGVVNGTIMSRQWDNALLSMKKSGVVKDRLDELFAFQFKKNI